MLMLYLPAEESQSAFISGQRLESATHLAELREQKRGSLIYSEPRRNTCIAFIRLKNGISYD